MISEISLHTGYKETDRIQVILKRGNFKKMFALKQSLSTKRGDLKEEWILKRRP